jgi:hypothetical protein
MDLQRQMFRPMDRWCCVLSIGTALANCSDRLDYPRAADARGELAATSPVKAALRCLRTMQRLGDALEQESRSLEPEA